LRPLLKSIELEIGGQKIDKQYWFWQQAWQELTYNQAQVNALYSMAMSMNAAAATGDYFYLPLDFYFCRNPGLALPLIALQYHEVKVRVEFNTAAEIRLTTTGVAPGTNLTALSSAELVCDYIYLDTDERRRFAQVSHEYLIEQVQFTGSNTLKASNTLNFNHPVKELIWVCQTDTCATESTASTTLGTGQGNTQNNFLNYSFTSGNAETVNGQTSYEAFVNGHLQLNGHDRFSARPASYFRSAQPYQHHDNVPSKHVYSYSFALKPSEHQPSGTCNFSRIDNASLKLTSVQSSSTIHVFAHSYNVLRVMSGMGGLAYSN